MFSEPLVYALWTAEDYTLDDYEAFINKPISRRVQLFENPWLEAFTFSKAFMPLCWLPFAIWEFVACELPLRDKITGTLGAVALWPAFEYAYHGVLFHSRGLLRNRTLIVLHFLAHGLHHLTPHDRDRLFVPPALFGVLYFCTRWIMARVLSETYVGPLACGVILGVIVYDYVHFLLHHRGTSKFECLRWLKRYHAHHHFKDYNVNFGVTSPVMDEVMGTKFEE
jgi:4-hydroxysphinganine ceramide fatty acyl 2-hydroxylase